jgi:spermidine synthase
MVIAYSIATTGFFGMLSYLVLIFSFQVFYGYLYYRIGILISVFMGGIALGSILATRFMERIKNSLVLFIKLEVIIAVFSLVLPLAINRFGGYMGYAYWIFVSLFFVPGLLMGIEFPIASKIYLGEKGRIGNTVGVLYSSDLVGGWFAGILGGILFLPVLGLFSTCILAALFKVSSILLLITCLIKYDSH